MRSIDAKTLGVLGGSRTGDRIIVRPWYGGRPSTADPLQVSSWNISWDASRMSNPFSCTVVDPDGSLSPWDYDSPLGVGGARLQVIYEVGGAGQINLGWYRITSPDPDEEWSSYIIPEPGTQTPDTPVPADKVMRMVPRGATIDLESEDLAMMIRNNRFLAPESPKGTSPTALSEIKRIAGSVCGVRVMPGVVDKAVNRNLIFKDDRMEAIQDLAARIACGVRMNGNGLLEVYPLDDQTPVATLRGGPEGLLVRARRSQSYDGLYNIFVVDGTTEGSNQPVRAITMIQGGPLRVNGPHGRYPTFYSSSMIKSASDAMEYARKMMDTQLRGLTIPLHVTCAPLPHLQEGDWVTVYNALVDGRTMPLNGRVVALSLRGSADRGIEPMELGVEVSYSAYKTAFSGALPYSPAGPVTRRGG